MQTLQPVSKALNALRPFLGSNSHIARTSPEDKINFHSLIEPHLDDLRHAVIESWMLEFETLSLDPQLLQLAQATEQHRAEISYHILCIHHLALQALNDVFLSTLERTFLYDLVIDRNTDNHVYISDNRAQEILSFYRDESRTHEQLEHLSEPIPTLFALLEAIRYNFYGEFMQSLTDLWWKYQILKTQNAARLAQPHSQGCRELVKRTMPIVLQDWQLTQ